MSQPFYIPDTRSRLIRYVDSSGIISTLPLDGSSDAEWNAHGGLENPWGITVNPSGTTLFIVDESPEVVYAVDTTTFVVRKVAGRGSVGGTLANNWAFSDIYGIACDSQGNFYVTDATAKVIVAVNMQATSQTLFGVTIAAGDAAIVVGNGTVGFSGDGGPALLAQLHEPFGIAFDAQDNLYFCDQLNLRIRKVDHTTFNISTVVGSGTPGGPGGYTGDGGPPTSATLGKPLGVALDAAGNIYITDLNNLAIRVVNTQSTSQTILGKTIAANTIDTVVSPIAFTTDLMWFCKVNAAGELGFTDPTSVFPPGGNLWKVKTDGTVVSIAGTGTYGTPTGDGGPATSARIGEPFDLAFVPSVATGTIVVNKVVSSPQASDHTRPFTMHPSWKDSFTLQDTQSDTSAGLAAGTYSITEDAVANFASAGVTDSGPISAITLAAGQTVNVTFTNTFIPPADFSTYIYDFPTKSWAKLQRGFSSLGVFEIGEGQQILVGGGTDGYVYVIDDQNALYDTSGTLPASTFRPALINFGDDGVAHRFISLELEFSSAVLASDITATFWLDPNDVDNPGTGRRLNFKPIVGANRYIAFPDTGTNEGGVVCQRMLLDITAKSSVNSGVLRGVKLTAEPVEGIIPKTSPNV